MLVFGWCTVFNVKCIDFPFYGGNTVNYFYFETMIQKKTKKKKQKHIHNFSFLKRNWILQSSAIFFSPFLVTNVVITFANFFLDAIHTDTTKLFLK